MQLVVFLDIYQYLENVAYNFLRLALKLKTILARISTSIVPTINVQRLTPVTNSHCKHFYWGDNVPNRYINKAN